MIPLFRVFMAPEAPQKVTEVLRSGYIGEGPRVEELERRFSELIGLEAVLTNSCTSAISLALHMIGVGPGDEVITTPITCTATNSPIIPTGARIVWADVDPVTGLIDPADVRRKLTFRSRAIIAVDWGGAPCDWKSLQSIGLPVIEDAAHAVLTPPGGDYVCYSFGPIKHLTCGDGGALVCPDPKRARLLRWYGLDRTARESFRCGQNMQESGYKYHMNDIAAAIGLSNLPYLKKNVQKCRDNALWYDKSLKGDLPPYHPLSSWWLYTIRVPEREQFVRQMASQDVECGQVHRRNDVHTGFQVKAYRRRPLPGVTEFDETNVAIPVGWWLSEGDRECVKRAIQLALE